MKKKLKYALLIVGSLIITILGFIIYGLYLMEIEDHYGDYKEVYFKSNDKDIIVNEEFSKFGIVEKNWKRIYIKTKEKDSVHLYTFSNKYKSEIKLYRPTKRIKNIKEMDYNDFQNLLEKNIIKLKLEFKTN
ncbi:hypothetical protein [Mesonia mobilis]|uniref:Lipoprotein n=1 Tax=Mesonia mobilis TaxID=369791 RepID=A0ABQ3C1R3_9FLAO|nr:hypothetical protein [Mesonia mobilis]GGZ64884.1 hypothetical protein GCM10008088_27940 [Mesonia mobilis]